MLRKVINGEEIEENHDKLRLHSSLLKQECWILQPDSSRSGPENGSESVARDAIQEEAQRLRQRKLHRHEEERERRSGSASS